MRNRNRIWLLSVLAAVCLLAFALRPQKVLLLESDHGTPLMVPVKTAETITLQYVHSIYHVRQQEVYQAADNELVLRSMFFGDMSAALYYDAYSRYALEQAPGGGYAIKGLDLRYPTVAFALGHGTEYEVYVGTAPTVDLNKAFPEAAFLTISTEEMSTGEYILRRLRNGNR